MAHITCPNCGTEFEPQDAISKSVEQEMRGKMEAEWRKRMDGLNAEKLKMQQKEADIQRQLQEQDQKVQQLVQAERKVLQEKLTADIRKTVSSDYENEMLLLKQNAAEQDEKLKNARQKELEYMREKQALEQQKQEMEITLQKQISIEREKLSAEIRGIEAQRLQQIEHDFKLKLAEKDKQLDDQKKLAEEMKRKAEQGSMQLQGEVQELELENMLRSAFPFDVVSEVGKGVRGADCIQTVRNNLGQECGRIIYESKRTQAFGTDWIEKLKADMRSQGAEIAVIVTQVMPKDMSC
ncbi:MAG: DUF2130 domain-containing protein, partial [Mucilaginibacter polytrichastri]|nr:DUF2130 domain-containing protein [Mucilaginibacter polytrichastri]